MIGRAKAFLALALLVPLSAAFAANAEIGDPGAAESADTEPGEVPSPQANLEAAIEAGNRGGFSANRCPQSPAYRPPGQPSLGISGTGGALYGQNYGENYGGGPGSTIDQSNAVLGLDCPALPGD